MNRSYQINSITLKIDEAENVKSKLKYERKKKKKKKINLSGNGFNQSHMQAV